MLALLGCVEQDPTVVDIETQEETTDDDVLGEPTDDLETDAPVALPDELAPCRTSASGCDDFEVRQITTTTSVQSSEGEYLTGLHHREHPLPDDIHRFSYSGVEPDTPAPTATALPGAVTLSIQHSTTYLYGDQLPETVDLEVRLPEGLATGWFPEVRQWLPGLPLTEVAGGRIAWTATPVSEQQDDSQPTEGYWETARQLESATPMRVDDEHQRYLGFEGVTTFEPPLHVSHHGDHFELHNDSDALVPETFLIKHRDDGMYLLSPGSIHGGETVDFSPAPKESPVPVENQRAVIETMLQDGLIDAGLTLEEAQTYLKGWEESILDEPGDRLLYVAPRQWTESWFPIDVDPAPEETTQMVVGRIELMHPDQEEAIAGAVERAYDDGTTIPEEFGDTVSEPRLRRGCQLVEQTDPHQWCLDRADEMAADRRHSVTW